MTSLALHFSPQPTRSARARWALEEAGLAYESRVVDVFQGEQNAPEYRALNPLGVVPTLTIDGEPMVESSAIALWAALEAPDAGLGARPGTAAWRALLQWTVFAPAELDRLLVVLNAHTRFRPPEARNAELVEETLQSLDVRARRISDALEGRPHLLGERFSAADICVGHSIVWMRMLDRLAGYPVLVRYLERLQKRPAFQTVYGPEVRVFPDPHARAGG